MFVKDNHASLPFFCFHSGSQYLFFHAFFPCHSPPPIIAESLKVLFWLVFVSPLEMKNIHISSLFSPATVSYCLLNRSWWLCSLKLAVCSQDEVHDRVVKGHGFDGDCIHSLQALCHLVCFSLQGCSRKKGLKGSNYLPALSLLLLTSLFSLCATYSVLFVNQSSQV